MPSHEQRRVRIGNRVRVDGGRARRRERLTKTHKPYADREAHGQLPLLIPDPEPEPSIEELQAGVFD